MSAARVLIVVPTLGNRPDFLRRCLSSIRDQSIGADITLVSPPDDKVAKIATEFSALVLPDPGNQAAAINLGAGRATTHHEYINWLGDDDLLTPGSLAATTSALDANPKATVAYGHCRYIDEKDRELWTSRAGPWAARILSWGPDLIPQPGMLVRLTNWRDVRGLDESYRFAFDLDLLLKLKSIGPLIDVGEVVSCFRWHAESLTVSDRSTNILESERAKRQALGPKARKVRWLWERPVRVATRLAASEMNRRLGHLQEQL